MPLTLCLFIRSKIISSEFPPIICCIGPPEVIFVAPSPEDKDNLPAESVYPHDTLISYLPIASFRKGVSRII